MLYIAAAIIGFVKNLAFPYFNLWHSLFIVFPLLYLLGYFLAKSFKQRLIAGFIFGFCFVLGGFYWIYNAVYIVTNSVALSALAVVGKSIIIGSFYSLMFIFKDILKNKHHLIHVFLFAVVYTFITFLKTKIVPWYHLPVVFSENLEFIQFLRFTNIHVANFLLTLLFLLPLVIFFKRKLFYSVATVAVVIVVLFAMYKDGINYIKNSQKITEKDFVLKIVQPNVNQVEKVRGTNALQRYQETLRMALKDLPKTNNKTIVILPETALDGALNKNKYMLQDIQNRLESNQYLITGALRKDDLGNIYNSLFVVDKNGIYETYDKAHLVPFGEYVPIIGKSIISGYGFASGGGYKNINIKGLNILPLICFEVGFIGSANVYKNTDIIVNITNDAWYGKTTQPYHHLALSSIHAIIAKKPLVRVSNNGISALVDKHGFLVISTKLNQKSSVLINLSI